MQLSVKEIGKMIESLEENYDPAKAMRKITTDATNRALEKMYKEDCEPIQFRGLALTEDLTPRALMAVIQELKAMKDYEDELRGVKRS